MEYGSSSSPTLWQEAQRHDSDWEPSPAILEEVANGTAICVTGALLAQTRYCASHFGRSECMIAWATDGRKLWLMAHLFVPHEQDITASHCVATGKAMLEVGRQAEAIEGHAMVCVIMHSHGQFPADFLSWTDVQTVEELADNGVGRETSDWQGSSNPVAPAPAAHGSIGQQQWVAHFPDHHGLSVGLTTARPDVTPEEFRVELQEGMQRMISCFGVVNARGDLFLPTFRRVTCRLCGSPLSEELEGRDVEIHIVGPEELPEEARQRLDTQLKQMTIRSVPSMSYLSSRRGEKTNRQPRGYRLPKQRGGSGHQTAVASADYSVWRQGEMIGRIPPALMERAAAQIPEVAECFGWNDPYAVAFGANKASEVNDVFPVSSDETVTRDGDSPTP
jgi:hypothetical protein